ncbi:MAG: hypothetical protein JWN15_3658 [Firmicutes bacterium]|nr:hypothetical protein [Bacillota bacterium]
MGSPQDNKGAEVLPSLRAAKTQLEQILGIVSQIETKTQGIAKNATSAFGGAGGNTTNLMAWHPTSSGQAGGVRTGAYVSPSAPQQQAQPQSNPMQQNSLNNSGGANGGSHAANLMPWMVAAAALHNANPQNNSNNNGGGNNNGLSKTGTLAKGAGSIVAGAMVSGVSGVTADDLTYNTLRMGMAGATTSTQRNAIPMGLASAFRGAIANPQDFSAMTGQLTGMGYSYKDQMGMGANASMLGKTTGMTGSQFAGMTASLTNPQTMMTMRNMGISMGDASKGGDLYTTVNSLVKRLWQGRTPTADEVNAAFKSGNVPNFLAQMGFDSSTIADAQRLMLGIASTGQAASNDAGWNKSAGLLDTAVTSSRNKSGAAAGLAAKGFSGAVAGTIAGNNTAASASDGLASLSKNAIDAATAVAGFAKALTSSEGGGSNVGGGLMSLLHDAVMAEVLKSLFGKSGGSGGAAAGGAATAGGRLKGGLGKTLAKGAPALAGGMADAALSAHGHKTAGKLANVAGDAATGALLGMAAGPWGAAAGGLIGGAIGFFTGDSSAASRAYSLDPNTDLNGPKDGNTISQLLGMAEGMNKPFRITSAYRPGGGTSYHAKGEAIDVADPSPEWDSPGLLAINQYFANTYGSQLAELIYAGPGGINIKDGKVVDGEGFYGAETMADHHHHVHVALKSGSNAAGAAGGGGGGGGNSKWADAASANLARVGGKGGLFSKGSSGAASAAAAGVSAGPSGAMPTGSLADWEKQALGILGKDYNTFASGLTNLIMHESSGNPHAQNNSDSNAKKGTPSKGLMQTIDSTFKAYALPGHTDIWSPVDNIIAGFRYAEKNYGDQMIEAGGRKDKNGNYLGYADGAWNLSSDQLAKVHHGEMILPTRIADAVRGAMTQGGSGGSGGNTVHIYATFQNTGAAEGQRFVKLVKSAVEGNNYMNAVVGS